jgi:hypothetical protein
MSLADAVSQLPLPATERWPEGVWDTEAFADGYMTVTPFTTRGMDYQSSHRQDELCIVLKGRGRASKEHAILLLRATSCSPLKTKCIASRNSRKTTVRALCFGGRRMAKQPNHALGPGAPRRRFAPSFVAPVCFVH